MRGLMDIEQYYRFQRDVISSIRERLVEGEEIVRAYYLLSFLLQ